MLQVNVYSRCINTPVMIPIPPPGRQTNKRKLSILLAAFLLTGILLSACAAATLDCSRADVFCVGLVTDVGRVNDRAFNQSAWEGLQQAQKELGAEVQYIETADSRDFPKNIAAFGDLKYDVIVTVGSSMADATTAGTTAYPDTDFIGVDQHQRESVEGVAGLVFPEDQAGFLAGALAAMISRSDRVGAVCATDEVPAIWRLGEGYRAGVAHANEEMDAVTGVSVIYHPDDSDAFIDPEWGAETARSMLEQGADVIFGCGYVTSDGALSEAANMDAYVIGMNTDQYFALPQAAPRMLSSVMKLVTPGVYDLIRLSSEGTFPSGDYQGVVGLAPFHALDNEVPAEVRNELEKIRAGLLDGSIRTNIPATKP